MTTLKQEFEKLGDKLNLKLIPHLEQELFNFAHLLKTYKRKKNVYLQQI